MKPLLHQVFDLSGRGGSGARARRRRVGAELGALRGRDERAQAPELLERRAMLAVDAFTQAAGGAVTRSWVTLVSDGGDSLYAEQISPAAAGQTVYTPSLIYANNSSFLGYKEIKGINDYSDVFVTNATTGYTYDPATYPASSNGQSSDAYPFIANGLNDPTNVDSYKTEFVLPTDDIDGTEAIAGQLTNGVGGTWTFHNTPGLTGLQFQTSDFTPVGSPAGPTPVSAVIIARGHTGSAWTGEFDLVMVVQWSSNVVGGAGGMDKDHPPQIDTIAYDRDGTGFVDLVTASNIVASSPYNPTYALPVPASVSALPVTLANGTVRYYYSVVPGSLAGKVDIPQFGVSLDFTTLDQFSSTLVFQGGLTATWNATGRFVTTGIDGGNGRSVTGTLDYVAARDSSGALILDVNGRPVLTPQVSLKFYAFGTAGFGGTAAPLGQQEVGPVQVAAKFAIFNQPTIGAGGDFTLFAGQDFTRRLTADLLASGSSIYIDSPVVYQAGVSPVDQSVDLRASNVYVNANVWSNTSLNVQNSQYGQAKAEQVFFNAANAAKTYDVRVEDDPNTDAVRRSKVLVSATGTLAAALPSAPNVLPPNASSVFMQANMGDIFVAGTIAADTQSYLMQSPMEPADSSDTIGLAHRAPYYFTTTAQISGARTGKLRGNTVAVTLGNDTPSFYVDTTNGGATAYNVVSLNTDIGSLRIRAADRQGNPLKSPFPYLLDVAEDNQLKVDALAASSLPLSIVAASDITFNSVLASASDVSLDSTAGNIYMAAPLTTIFGQIQLAANRLNVANSVRVLDSVDDPNRTDISLVARAGDLQLTGPISAINGISLTQVNDPKLTGRGRIYGNARVVASSVIFDSQGGVDLKTDTGTISGRAVDGISIDEANDLVVTDLVSQSGVASVTANGVDVIKGTDENGNPIRQAALKATMSDVSSLTLSAPNGSIDARVTSANNLTIGDATKIVAGTATPMVAAGQVRIVSAGGSIDVLDGPVAGSSAYRVRAASTGNLVGTYSQRSPGTLPSTLKALPDSGSGSYHRLLIDGVAVQVGEEILLKNQDNANENGVYTVTAVGVEGSKTAGWALSRSAKLDTTAELVPNMVFSVGEGATQSGQTFAADGYQNTVNVTPRSVSSVLNAAGAYEVRAVSTSALNATFSASISAVTITSNVTESIPATAFDGVNLVLGDLVLVRMGVTAAGSTNTACNGVYQVTSIGSSAGSSWELTKVDDFETGLVVSSEGTLSSRLTGNGFQVAYDSLGNANLAISPFDWTADPALLASVRADGAGFALTTEYGSEDLNDVVRYVVSTNGGTNAAVGSLGKMIQLANNNIYSVPPDVFADPADPRIPQKQALAFASTLRGAIQLTQELPRIETNLTIDAVNGPRVPIGGSGVATVSVDGSRITMHSNGVKVKTGETVNGFVFGQNPNLAPYGISAASSTLAGLRIGGFTGAAVKVDSVNDVRIDRVVIGQDAQGRKLANGIGVSVVDGGGFTTISNSTIQSSAESGVKVAGNRSNVRLVGNTIGGSKFENVVGVNLVDGTNYIGLSPANVVVKGLSVTTTASASTNWFTVPAAYSGKSALYVGLGVTGARVTPVDGVPCATITNLQTQQNGDVKVTIDGTIVAGTSGMAVNFGVFASVVLGDTTMALPTGLAQSVNPGLYLYPGQAVTAPGLAFGTVITAIDLTNNVVTLSKPAVGTGIQQLTFGDAGRNTIAYNYRGIVLDGGANRIVNNDITNSVFDGIVINGGSATIGGGSGKQFADIAGSTATASDAKAITLGSNSIYGNSGAGIRFGLNSVSAGLTQGSNQFTILSSSPIVKYLSVGQSVSATGLASGTTIASVASNADTGVTTVTLSNNYTGTTGNQTLTITAALANVVIQGNRLGVTAGNQAVVNKLGNIIGSSLAVDQTVAAAYTAAAGVVTIKLTNHGLSTGQKIWLEFTGGSLNNTKAAYTITRVDQDTFTVQINGAVQNVTSTLRMYRYGSTATAARAAQLLATNQMDFEGNQHGPIVATTAGSTASTSSTNGGPAKSGVLPRPVVLPPKR